MDAIEKLKELHRFTDSLFHYETGEWRPYQEEPSGLRKLLGEVGIAIRECGAIDNTPGTQHSDDLLHKIIAIAQKHGSELPYGSVEVGHGCSANLTFLDTGDTKKIEEEVRRILPEGTEIDIQWQHVEVVNTNPPGILEQ